MLVAFHSDRDGDKEIYVMNADGTGLVTQPDGEWIAFESTNTGNEEIYLKRADGTGTATNLTTAFGDDRDPDWR